MSLGWALAQCDWCSSEEGNLDMQTHRETAMWRHTGTQTYRPGAMRRWERKLQWCCHKPGSLKLQKLRQGRILFIESLEGECPWQHFNFGLGASRTERTHLCCLNHPVCGALLGSHREWTPYPAELLPSLLPFTAKLSVGWVAPPHWDGSYWGLQGPPRRGWACWLWSPLAWVQVQTLLPTSCDNLGKLLNFSGS